MVECVIYVDIKCEVICDEVINLGWDIKLSILGVFIIYRGFICFNFDVGIGSWKVNCIFYYKIFLGSKILGI